MAARGSHPTVAGQVTSRPVPNAVQDSFVTLLALAYAAVIVAIVVGFFRYRDRWKDPQSHWLANFVLVLLLMGIVTTVGYYGMRHSYLRHKVANAQAQQARGAHAGARLRPRPVPARTAHFEWPLALAIGGVLVLGGGVVYLHRNPAEAPFEYLARVLRGLDVRDSAVRTLTALFEYAKFSPHEIDEGMKDDAIGALVAMRSDLERGEELAA